MSAPVVTHPGWCDPRRCFEADGDTQHCSELVSVRTQDARLTLAWVRADEEGGDPRSGVSELRIDILYGTAGADAQLFLLPLEAYQLAEQLLSCYWREYYQHPPVVRGARVVTS
jgi:hypothetical protein